MNEISTIVDGDRMTSLQIAEITGKRHADVMKSIRKMEPAWEKVAEGKFSLGSYKDENNQYRPCYSLNKEVDYDCRKFDRPTNVLRINLSERAEQRATNVHHEPRWFHSAGDGIQWQEGDGVQTKIHRSLQRYEETD